MQKINDLEKWDLSEVASAQQKASVSVFVPFPKITAKLIELTPKERKRWIAQQMRRDLDEILASQLLTNWKLQRGQLNGIKGEVFITNLPALAELASVESIRVESIDGCPLKPAKSRKKKSFYCVKMTVAIQIEGKERGIQDYEERYVLFKAYTEDEAWHKAEEEADKYGHTYLGGSNLLVRWKVESVDAVYEVMLGRDADGRPTWDGAEVFSVLKGRRITEERAWRNVKE